MTPPETTTDARIVEGSNGMLLEIDGQILPNYDATIVPFDEGDVVTGKVVRIDKDEVLIDIGYKSEGVIPNNELSIRKSVDPSEEVELGEEVDALVLTKEDQDGRLILSKKRARFEKAWRRIEGAAESGDPVAGSVIEVVKGGLIIDLGVRGASLVRAGPYHSLALSNGDTLLGWGDDAGGQLGRDDVLQAHYDCDPADAKLGSVGAMAAGLAVTVLSVEDVSTPVDAGRD